MNNKKQFAFNNLFNIFMIIGSFLLWGAYILLTESAIKSGIGIGVIGLIFIVIPLFFMPCCYIFNNEGVTLKYLFFPVERYLWKNIHSIEATEDRTSSHGHDIFDLLFSRIFKIEGNVEVEKKTYMSGHICRSFRTRRLIEKYWDGTITGDTSIFSKKRKNKSKNHTYSTEEIAPMECEWKAKLKQFLTPFDAQAKQYNLVLKKKYVYTTEDLKELNYRPKENYTYTLIVEISHPNETDKNRVVLVGVDLIYVRLGKKAYKGVVNKEAEGELAETLADVLKEINENGIEVYCRNN